MLQRQWDLIPLCLHALRVGAIVLVVNRHCLPIGERSTSNRSRTATDRAIEPQMRISGPPTVPIVILAAFECVRSAAHSQQASSCALNVVKLVCGPGRTVVRGILRRAGHGAHGDAYEQCAGADDVHDASPEIMTEYR
jgi:hypothetical protein